MLNEAAKNMPWERTFFNSSRQTKYLSVGKKQISTPAHYFNDRVTREAFSYEIPKSEHGIALEYWIDNFQKENPQEIKQILTNAVKMKKDNEAIHGWGGSLLLL